MFVAYWWAQPVASLRYLFTNTVNTLTCCIAILGFPKFAEHDLGQGCHQSAQFKFPDFPWLFRCSFPWLSLTSWHRSDGYRVKSRAKRAKIWHLQPLGFYKNMSRNQGQTLGHLSQIIFPDFPWLSTKNIEIPWLSRRSKFSLIFPDGGNPARRSLPVGEKCLAEEPICSPVILTFKMSSDREPKNSKCPAKNVGHQNFSGSLQLTLRTDENIGSSFNFGFWAVHMWAII